MKYNYSSVELKDTLNPSIFDEQKRVHSDLRKKMLNIADEFWKFNDTSEVTIKDIILTGSMANYNWSEESDIDIHILVDYEDLCGDKDVASNLYDTKKVLWSLQHDIKIGETNEYDVELFVADVTEKLPKGVGVYSLRDDEWIILPSKSYYHKFDKAKTDGYINKAIDMYNKIRGYLKTDKSKAYYYIKMLLDYLHKLRKFGLSSKYGEFSDENIAFKMLRRMGMIDNLRLMQRKIFDSSQNGDGNIIGKGGSGSDIEKSDKSDGEYDDGVMYRIKGQEFSTLRDAEAATGIPKSTIQYRVVSTNPKYSDYQRITTN